MAEMVLTPPLRADGREPNFLQKFGHAFVHGDIFTKLSLFVWGLGYISHGQLIKALLVTLVQGLGLYFLGTSGIPALKKFGTLGTVQMEMQFNPLTLKNEVNNYDNSFAILLLSVIALVVIVTLIAAAMLVVQSNYALQAQKAAGKKPNNFRQDITLYLNEKFYVTLLTLPVLGVVVFTIIPLFILIAVAFTNYDQQHMPPAALFTWVGLANFASLFGGQSLSLTFSYAFGRVLSWTLVWAFFATFTNFFGGVFLAMLINNKKTKCQKLWRTLFMITIAVPQFVTLLLVRNFFSDAGIFNTMMTNIEVRNSLLPAGEREKNIAADLKDTSWFNEIQADGGVIFFASGVFYYFLTEDVKALFLAMAEHFAQGRIVFDTCGKTGAKMISKTWLKQAEIKDVNAYFSVGDAQKEIAHWSDKFEVSSRGYMLGYQSLNVPSVKKIHRILAKIGDNMMKMKIVRIDFE